MTQCFIWIPNQTFEKKSNFFCKFNFLFFSSLLKPTLCNANSNFLKTKFNFQQFQLWKMVEFALQKFAFGAHTQKKFEMLYLEIGFSICCMILICRKSKLNYEDVIVLFITIISKDIYSLDCFSYKKNLPRFYRWNFVFSKNKPGFPYLCIQRIYVHFVFPHRKHP